MKLLQKSALGLIRLKLKLLAVLSPAIAARSAFRTFCTPQVRHSGEPTGVFSEAKIINTTFNGTAIRGYRWNKGAAIRAMVVHGFESSVVNFETYIAALAAKGYEVIAFDAPAHGKSGGKRMHVLDYRDFIHFTWKEFGQPARFIAHSVGGLALCMAVAETTPNQELRIALIAPLTESNSTFNLFSSFLDLSKKVRKEFDRIIIDISGNDLHWFSITRAMKTIDSQVLWYHDRTDLITPFSDLGPLIRENYPNVHFVFTDGLGHRRIYRDIAVTAAIIDYL